MTRTPQTVQRHLPVTRPIAVRAHQYALDLMDENEWLGWADALKMARRRFGRGAC